MPKETVSLLLSELSKIEQTVLWKWESDEVPQLPKNVIIRKWFPQNDILGEFILSSVHGNVVYNYNIIIIILSKVEWSECGTGVVTAT